ncbi:MAG: tRNA dihydrouridine synthase DusB [Burkholderiaceae bacterium]|jgi:tRNA-dihydrouridine synthase B|nr:tRNA dihydrouridine synthase DusB [Burkholderiaceae bacterium]
MRLGSYTLPNNVFVAPMAGITDLPFRRICEQMGAGYAVAEMAAANPLLWRTRKSWQRTRPPDTAKPHAVQIVGASAAALADAARYHVEQGAQIIDINMGCPAKKVCNNWCGSALLRDEKRVAAILAAVTRAVSVPVTLKMRSGWDRQHRNALGIAKIAEAEGIAMLVLHGRTREEGYQGVAEYDTLRRVREKVSIPLVANGDIDSPEKAKRILAQTGADAVMIGRAARGRPWVFREILHFLQTGEHLPPPDMTERRRLMQQHLRAHYAFYGNETGVRTARKHIGWYLQDLPASLPFQEQANRADTCEKQMGILNAFWESQQERKNGYNTGGAFIMHAVLHP